MEKTEKLSDKQVFNVSVMAYENYEWNLILTYMLFVQTK